MVYFTLSTILFILGLGLIYWIHQQAHMDIVVQPAASPGTGPLISVCVPARNEERNIRTCIESILKQDYPDFELILLDDRSTDATPRIIGQLKAFAGLQNIELRILHGTELPPGWAGKPHALHQAAQAAHGEWLCFVDADTFLEPWALSSVYAKALETRADLFTILTRQIMGTFWEKTILPLVMTGISVGFSVRRVNDPKRHDAIANGQFILIKRLVYDAIGGYESIKDQIVEDKALAERAKWSGHRLIVADGRYLASTRMYTSLPSMWEGWTKNIFLGLSDRPSLMLLGAGGALLLVIAAVFMPVWPLLGVYWYLHGGGWLAALVIAEALIVWAALIAARAQVARAMGISGWWALTTPLAAGVFAAMMLASAWKVLSGRGVTWKGRVYSQK